MVGMILIRPVQKVAMEKQGIPGFHYHVDKFQTLPNLGHAVPIRAGLLARQHVINAPEFM
jgi:hypothetical protein